MIKDMTKGCEWKLILFFSVPLLLGNLFQQFYNLVDSIVVGRFVGARAFAAVGTSMPIVFLVVSLVMGLAMGASILISQLFGAGKTEQLRQAIATAILFMLAASVILSLAGMLISKPVLKLLNTPEEIMAEAVTYLRIIFGGMIFMFAYNMLAAIFRALGDSKTPLYFLIITSLLNVFLDLVFVIVFRMGVAGVAYATVIAQAVSSVLCVLYIRKRDIRVLKFTWRELKFERHTMYRILKLGIPSSAQQTILSVGFLAVQGLVNSFGSITMAAFFAASRIEQLVSMPNMNLGMALSTFTSQNMGAGRVDRVKRGYRSMLLAMTILTAATGSLLLLAGPFLIRLFIPSAETGVILQGTAYLKTVSYFLLAFGLMFLTNSLLRGAGDVNISMLSTVVVFAVRLGAAYIMAPRLGPAAIWWSLPIGWALGLTIAIARYLIGSWQRKAAAIISTPMEAEV